VYVGDTGTDMQTATAAGMYAVGALWGFRTAKELLENGAKLLIERPTDLIEHL
jgi:phosphoglycolate phosphatase